MHEEENRYNPQDSDIGIALDSFTNGESCIMLILKENTPKSRKEVAHVQKMP
jgi:hypothetical protein